MAARGAEGMGFSGAALCGLGGFPSSAQSLRAERRRTEVVFMLTSLAKGSCCRQVPSARPPGSLSWAGCEASRAELVRSPPACPQHFSSPVV